MNERYELFKKLNEESLELYKAKNADYGNSFSKSYKEFGLTAPIIRMSDKLERLKTLSKAEARVKDESIRDTLVDLANYAFMTVLEMEEDDVEDIPLALDKDGEPIVPKEIKPGLKTGTYRGYLIYIRHESDIFTTSFPSGYYCGYVAIPFSHPYCGIPYQFIDDLDVHGGLTFSGALRDIATDKYLVGFDCGHGGDDIKVQNEDYTLAECKRLVDQLIEVENDGSPEISISQLTEYERWLIGARPKKKCKSEKEYTEGDKLNI